MLVYSNPATAKKNASSFGEAAAAAHSWLAEKERGGEPPKGAAGKVGLAGDITSRPDLFSVAAALPSVHALCFSICLAP